jgi:Amt family ammonium transporter
MVMVGAAMLWVGWYGFNAGSALAANGGAGMAMTVTHISAAAAALTWMAIEWSRYGKPSLIGTVTGSIAGLATITPASGFVGPLGGLVLGITAGIVCFGIVQLMRQRLKIDDSLDVFAVHGVGGGLGILLAAVFAAESLGGVGHPLDLGIAGSFTVQITGVVAVALWAGVGSFIILKLVGLLTGGLRVDKEEEIEGLDITSHGERAYDL